MQDPTTRRQNMDEGLREQFAEVIGQRITGVRVLTPAELDALGWDESFRRPYTLVVEDHTLLIVSQDEEGNGPGEIFVEPVDFA